MHEHMLFNGLMCVSLKHQNLHVSLLSIFFYQNKKDISVKRQRPNCEIGPCYSNMD